MSPNSKMNQNINEITKISRRIVDIFEQLANLELNQIYQRELYKRPVTELKELLIKERALYNTIALDSEFLSLSKEIIHNNRKFQMKFGATGDALKRMIIYFVTYFRNNNSEFGFNLLNQYPEFMNLEFPSNMRNSTIVFDAFKEEMYREYLDKISDKIRNPLYQNIREKLIEKKYNSLKTDAPTNTIYAKSFSPRRGESRLSRLLRDNKTNQRHFEYFKTEYLLDFFRMYFTNDLEVDDSEIINKEIWADVIDKLTIVETMLEMLDHDSIQTVNHMFYRYYYNINTQQNIENKMISASLVNLFDKVADEKKKLKK